MCSSKPFYSFTINFSLMKKKFNILFAMLWLPALLTQVMPQVSVKPNADEALFVKTDVKPQYKRTNYANQSILLKNDRIQLQMFRRIGGWGWGEISTPSGKFMAVLDHLGEIMLRDQDIPMRFEA